MAGLSIDELVSALAQRTGTSEEQVRALLQAQADVAHRCVFDKIAVPVPGVGLLSVADWPPRILIDPAKGERVQFPAKKKLRFAYSKLLMRALAGAADPTPDVLAIDPYADSDPLAD